MLTNTQFISSSRRRPPRGWKGTSLALDWIITTAGRLHGDRGVSARELRATIKALATVGRLSAREARRCLRGLIQDGMSDLLELCTVQSSQAHCNICIATHDQQAQQQQSPACYTSTHRRLSSSYWQLTATILQRYVYALSTFRLLRSVDSIIIQAPHGV